MTRSVGPLLVAAATIAVLAGPASAQDMTTGDLQRLEQSADELSAEVARLRTTDRTTARAMQAELLEIDDEITYLKIKQRKEGTVSRADYMSVRDRLYDLRNRVNGTETSAGRSSTGTGATGNVSNEPPRTTTTASGVIPAGTELDVRLETALSSDTNQVEDRFDATTVVDLRQDGRTLIPAGSRVRGVVTAVRDAGRVERKGGLSLSFDQITINGRTYPIRGAVTELLESGGYKEDADKIGTGAAVGGILGGILGGLKGALAGILIGGGGVVAATEGENVELAPGTVLRMRLDQDLDAGRP